jgi:hypothetical protein
MRIRIRDQIFLTLDPEWKKNRIRDKHLGSTILLKKCYQLHDLTENKNIYFLNSVGCSTVVGQERGVQGPISILTYLSKKFQKFEILNRLFLENTPGTYVP